jgi:acid phosphatase family membrane protein YuiD
MIKELLYRDIFLVPVWCGFLIQVLKVSLYSLAEKRFAFERFLQPYGLPNLHSAVFGSLSTVMGIKYGVSSILFSFITTYSAIIIHDTMRLKGEKGKQGDILNRLIVRLNYGTGAIGSGTIRTFQLRPFDVLSGAVMGVLGTILIL